MIQDIEVACLHAFRTGSIKKWETGSAWMNGGIG